MGINSVVDGWVSSDGGVGTVEARVNHVGLLVVYFSEAVVVSRRDIVANAEDASGELLVLVKRHRRDDPLVGVGHDGTRDVDVTQVVITREFGSEAVGSWQTPGVDLNPLVSVLDARSLVPVGGLVVPDVGDVHGVGPILLGDWTSRDEANSLFVVVLGVGSIVRAATSLGSEDGNILPGGRSPVRIVVAFFGAFESVTVSVVVLTGGRGRSTNVLIGQEQTSIAVAGAAGNIPRQGLLLSTDSGQQRIVRIVSHVRLSASSTVIGTNGVGGVLFRTIADPGAAHVLQNEVAVHVGVVGAATMLVGPFHLQ